MAKFFQPNFFQNDFFQVVEVVPGTQEITSRLILQDPIDCVLAGQQKIYDRYREWEIQPKRLRSVARGRHSGIKQLKGGKPSFTVTTNKKGYD